MTSEKRLGLGQSLFTGLNERNLSIIVHSLFSAWMLSMLFEGQILYSLTDSYGVSPHPMIFSGIAGVLLGLWFCGFFVKTKQHAKNVFLVSYAVSISASVVFFYPPSHLWTVALIVASLLAGASVAAWGFYLRSSTPRQERTKTIADMLILSNVLMITLNMTAIHLRPELGLALSILFLVGAFLLALQLPTSEENPASAGSQKESPMSMVRLLAFLHLFITIITITSGLMYEVSIPAFAHLEWITSWYWAIPYIVALVVLRNLPRKTNRTLILYAGMSMIGLSFIAFVVVDPSPAGYLVVNTLMLGAFGIYVFSWFPTSSFRVISINIVDFTQTS